jgi:hypothetical protein
MVRVTTNERNFTAGIICFAILVVVINILLLDSMKNLIALFALLCLLVLLFIYNYNFVNLFVDGEKIVLRKFNKDIEVLKFIKVVRLPIFSSKRGSLRTVFLIKYMNMNQKMEFRFLDIPSEKVILFTELEKKIGKESGTL